MRSKLNDVEARILGCLVEKEATTPDNYPLTVNSLISACNQKTNRFPVVEYDEETVTDGLDGLRDKNLVYMHFGGTSRVVKYKHLVPKILDLAYPEVALLCVLLLRGPQTAGEIKSRTARLYGFADVAHVNETLAALSGREEALVVNLGRQPGQKESRFMHLLCGEVDQAEFGSPVAAPAGASSRHTELEEKIEVLSEELKSLRSEFEEFVSRFE